MYETGSMAFNALMGWSYNTAAGDGGEDCSLRIGQVGGAPEDYDRFHKQTHFT